MPSRRERKPRRSSNRGKEYYDKLRKVNDLISGSEKVKESVLMLGDISEIYVDNFGKMLADKNYTQKELNAISAGYNTIMKKSSRSIAELKNIINPTGMSMNDKERIDMVDRVHREMTHYRGTGQLLHPQEPACFLPACQGEERTATGIRPVRKKTSVTGNHSIKIRVVCC